MKTGFISIIGKTNAGKSTLINALTRSKISIVTPKKQTTRDSIQGIFNDADSQIVFIDTPGILEVHQKLDKYMNRQAYSSLNGIDGVIYLIDSSEPISKERDEAIAYSLRNIEVPLFLVFNKVDLTNINLITKLKEEYLKLYPKGKIIEISAKDGFNLDTLIKEIKEILPEGFKYYPDDMKSNHPLTFLLKEIIREQILLLTRDEIPHSSAVVIDKLEKNNNAFNIHATIVVERDSQKKIIIGKNGSMIKKIGQNSRRELQKLLGKNINLETFVRVEDKWRDSTSFLKEFGYSDED